MSTGIEWTDKVWNPVTGCDAVSPGCNNCYAKKMAKRLKAMGLLKYTNEFDVTIHYDVLDKPSEWKKPCRIFVNSMSDLFHHDVPNEFVTDIFKTMGRYNQHVYQILTKRPEIAIDYIQTIADIKKRNEWFYQGNKIEFPLPNVWLGVSAENQEYADIRIPQLLQIPASKRFVSCEPLLGEIKIRPEWVKGWDDCEDGIDWVIIGCESGHNRRECNIDWVHRLVGDCNAFGIKIFVKQIRDGKKVIKKIEGFPNDLQIQEFPS